MFGNDSKPSKRYSYGSGVGPIDHQQEVADQMWRAHRYRNDLVANERQRRDEAAAAMRERFPEIQELEDQAAALEAELEAARAVIKAKNVRARSKTADQPQRQIVATLRRRLKDAWALLKARKATAWADPALEERLANVDAEALARAKALRASCGVFWGSYLAVEQSLQGMRSGPPPQFRAWRGDGNLAVQIQGGMTIAEALGCEDSRVRIEMLPRGHRVDHRTGAVVRTGEQDGSGRHAKPRAVLWIRIGSQGRAPVWARVPFQFHRPLPEEARIKWVYLHRRRVGTITQWSVQFVLEQEGGWHREGLARDGAVGIDPGWWPFGGALRVALWKGDDGATGEIILPADKVADWRHVDSLRGARDTAFNAARGELSLWLAEHGLIVPEWLAERAKFLGQWRSANRLASLVLHWRANRFDGDEVIYASLNIWRRADKRRYDEAENLRQKLRGWRDQHYREAVARMRGRYRVAFLENTDWRKMARRPAPERAEVETEARWYQRIAAVGRLLEIVREGMGESVSVEAADTTRRCHLCGWVNRCVCDPQADCTCSWRKHLDRVMTCQQCGEQWDQDVNAAHNLLASGQVMDQRP